jgi:hypothetical protein
MDPEILLPLLAHAGLAFLQAFWKGPSQYDDLIGVEVSGLGNPMKLEDLFKANLTEKISMNKLLIASLVWVPLLRILAFIPAPLYALYILLWYAKGVFERLDVNLLSSILFSAAFGIQLLYTLLKAWSDIPVLLMEFSPRYRNISYIFILLDLAPLLIRRRGDGGK